MQYLYSVFTFLSLGLLITLQPLQSKAQHESSLDENNPLQVSEASFSSFQINPGQNGQIKLKLNLPEGYRAYADQFKLTSEESSQFKVGQVQLNPVVNFYDENTKKNKKGVIKYSELTATFEAPLHADSLKSPAVFLLTYQACTKTFCLFPKTIPIQINFKSSISEIKTTEVTNKSTSSNIYFWQRSFQDILANENIYLVFVFIFLAGFLTSLTPCVFPMIPITISVLGRQAHARTHKETLLVAHFYILGIALTYASLGVIAASTGALFGSFMNSPWVLGFVCFVFLAMAISMFGYYEIQAPQWIQQKLSQQTGSGYFNIFLTGAIAGIVASPCVGPVLVGVLTYVAQTKNLFFGFWALFVFALGMGQLFLVLGLTSSATRYLPKSGQWMDGIKHFFGLLMLGAFYYYLSLLVQERIYLLALGVGFIFIGSLQGAFVPNEQLVTVWHRLRKGLCQALILIGASFIVFSIYNFQTAPISKLSIGLDSQPKQIWKPYNQELFAKALLSQKPIILDFYADWCTACHELENKTFSNLKFSELIQNFQLFRFDATNDSEELQKLRVKYQIVGLPTVLFFNSGGSWRKDLTLTEFENIDDFSLRLKKLNP